MKRNLSRAIVLALMLLAANSSIARVPSRVMAQPPTPAKAATSGYRLIEAKGEVLVHRVGDETLMRINVNAPIYPGDLLIVRKGAIAKVRCSDGQSWTLPEGVSGVLNGCQLQNSRDPSIPNPRTSAKAVDEQSPYIISPRQTALLDPQPKLRWNATPGAKHYTVKVWQDSGLVWQMQVSSSEVVYAGSPLQRGIKYRLTVQAEPPNSSEMQYANFWLLDEQTAQKARSRLEILNQQRLSDRALALAKAHIYSAYGLFAEAIDALEGLVANGHQKAAVYQMLGALYEQVGLNAQAGHYYLRAIALSGD